MGGIGSGRTKGSPNKVRRLRHEFDYKALGQCLKDARLRTELTQEAVAENLFQEKYRNRIAGWEQGVTTHNMSMDSFLVLCEGYGVRPSEILSQFEEKK